MKKTIAAMVVLVVLSVVIGAQVSNADTVEKSGLRVSSPWPSIIRKALDTNPNTSTGVVMNNPPAVMQPGSTTLQEGFVYNSANFTKKIVISLHSLPDGTTASLLMANTMTGPPPEYPTRTIFLPPHTWQKIELRPARWDAREYNLNTGRLIESGDLYVYIAPGIVEVPPSLKQKTPDRNTMQEKLTEPTPPVTNPKTKSATPASFAFCYPQG